MAFRAKIGLSFGALIFVCVRECVSVVILQRLFIVSVIFGVSDITSNKPHKNYNAVICVCFPFVCCFVFSRSLSLLFDLRTLSIHYYDGNFNNYFIANHRLSDSQLKTFDLRVVDRKIQTAYFR